MERSIDDDLALLESMTWDDVDQVLQHEESIPLKEENPDAAEEDEEGATSAIEALVEEIKEFSTRSITSPKSAEMLNPGQNTDISLVVKSGDARLEINHDMLKNWESSCVSVDDVEGNKK